MVLPAPINAPCATPPRSVDSTPSFSLFPIRARAFSRPLKPMRSLDCVGPMSTQSPIVVIPSVDTAASTAPAAASSLPARANRSALVIGVLASPLAARAACASLPTLDAAPIPGTTNCVTTSAPLPRNPSGSKPSASRAASAASVTLSP